MDMNDRKFVDSSYITQAHDGKSRNYSIIFVLWKMHIQMAVILLVALLQVVMKQYCARNVSISINISK